MIPRELQGEFLTQLGEFPIVTVLGPRQAGKTTLARMTLPDYEYVSLEDPQNRTFAAEDPRAFLKRYRRKVILDEIQRAPHLLSYLQGIVDEEDVNGQFVLTGSHQLELRQAVAQSLAGRTGMLYLLPLSIAELTADDIHLDNFTDYIFHGFLPRVHAQKLRPHTAYGSYYQTYVERDVRQLVKLKDASLFEKFMKLLAGRVGQLLNVNSLGNDVGVDSKTIRHWLSILEASFVIFKLAPYFENLGKRVIKSPKYYFTDTGLLAFLLGIETVEQVGRDPLVGSLFENLVILEALKTRYNRGMPANLYFFRDSHGREIDLLQKSGNGFIAAEIKSSSTYHPVFKKELLHFKQSTAPLVRACIVYNGEHFSFDDGIEALPFRRTGEMWSP